MSSGPDDLETRIKQMEDTVKSFSNKSAEKQIEESLAHVRILASRPNLTQSYVLLAAIELLVTLATKHNCKEADYYSKAYTYCKKFEDAKDLCNLAMKLFGSAEDKKLANLVAEWMKGKKYEGSPKKVTEETDKENKFDMNKNISQNHGYLNNPASFGFPYPGAGGIIPPYFVPPPYQQFQGGYGQNRFGGRGRSGYSRRGRCLFCKEQGHFVANCPKIVKKE